ncbi:hypothetical protein [Desulfobacca acetoxidans]|nr:hypothetical protein [Desulfobacterales bacterium]
MNAVIILCLLLSWPFAAVWTADANVTGQTRMPESFQQEINESDRIIDRAIQEQEAFQSEIPASFHQEINETVMSFS